MVGSMFIFVKVGLKESTPILRQCNYAQADQMLISIYWRIYTDSTNLIEKKLVAKKDEGSNPTCRSNVKM